MWTKEETVLLWGVPGCKPRQLNLLRPFTSDLCLSFSLFLLFFLPELGCEKNNLNKGSQKDQEENLNPILPLTSPPGQGGFSIEQGGVSIEHEVLNNEDRASGTGNEENPTSRAREESNNKATGQEEEKVQEGVAKCQEGKPPSENPSSIDDAKLLPGPQGEGGEARGVRSAQGGSEGQEEQSDTASHDHNCISHPTPSTEADNMEDNLKGEANDHDEETEKEFLKAVS